jgi:hypothetical protein
LRRWTRLKGLDPSARYRARNYDAEGATEMSGRDLMEKGILVQAVTPPTSWLFAYRAVSR